MSDPLPGWKLVPVEPTLPMLVAGNKASLDVSVLMDDSSHSCERACYAAMIAAAPSQPQGNADQLTEGGDRRAAHDALPLIDRLRHTPNWMRESYGSWKDCVLTYDRAPFEAADELERLSASPLHAPQEPIGFAPQAQIDNLVRNCQPLDVTLLSIGQRARGDRNVPIYAAPAPVDPESQGSSEPRLSDRDLIDRFDL